MAWFFIDLVDEAKLDGIRLDQACRELAAGVHGAEARSSIILSGRLTDWEFKRDLRRLNEELPIVTEKISPAPLTGDELVLRVIHNEVPEEPKSEPQISTRRCNAAFGSRASSAFRRRPRPSRGRSCRPSFDKSTLPISGILRAGRSI